MSPQTQQFLSIRPAGNFDRRIIKGGVASKVMSIISPFDVVAKHAERMVLLRTLSIAHAEALRNGNLRAVSYLREDLRVIQDILAKSPAPPMPPTANVTKTSTSPAAPAPGNPSTTRRTSTWTAPAALGSWCPSLYSLL